MRATVDYVNKAIMDPDREVDVNYHPLLIVLKDGNVFEGMRLHENTYRVLLIDEQDRLISISK